MTLKRLGIEVRFTSREERPEEFLALTDEKTRAWWVESIGNPALNIPDLEALAQAAREKGWPSSWTTPSAWGATS